MTNLTKPQILTDKEIENSYSGKASVGNGWQAVKEVAEAQRDDTFRETLKMVSGWLVRKVYADGLLIPHSIIDELNQLAGEK